MIEKPKKGASDEAQDAAFDVRVRKLCARLEVPFDIPELSRWVLIGVKLALNEPELKLNKKPGAPKGGRYPKDQIILDVIEDVMGSQQLKFDEVLRPVVERLLKENKLPPADRTTHPKRLKRLYKQRPVTMARFLLNGWDK